VSALLLLTSCGRQYKAKGIVKDFVKTYAAGDIDITSFSDLDSTKVICDSLLQAIRQKAQSDPLFRHDFKLGDVPSDPTLLYIRMRYQLPNDTMELSRTFYFDRDLSQIVAFK